MIPTAKALGIALVQAWPLGKNIPKKMKKVTNGISNCSRPVSLLYFFSTLAQDFTITIVKLQDEADCSTRSDTGV